MVGRLPRSAPPIQGGSAGQPHPHAFGAGERVFHGPRRMGGRLAGRQWPKTYRARRGSQRWERFLRTGCGLDRRVQDDQ